MDPISSMLIAGGGILMQGIGSIFSASASSDYNAAQKQQINLEQQVEGKKQQYMEMQEHAKQLGMLRAQQRVHAMSLATATAQGAQFGSGLQGAYGQETAETNTNVTNSNLGLQFGSQIFGLNSQISQQRIAMADAQQGMQFGAGLSSFGGSVTNFGLSLGKMQGFSGPDNRAPSNPYGQ